MEKKKTEELETVAKKGDMLFVGKDEDTLAVVVLDTLKYKGSNYLKVIATPIMVENVFDELADAEYVRENVNEEQYSLEPVVDKPTLDALIEGFKTHKNETEQTKA